MKKISILIGIIIIVVVAVILFGGVFVYKYYFTLETEPIDFQTADWSKYTQEQLMAMANPNWQNEAMFFKALAGNFLIIDQGTAPYPRGLLIYNLNLKRQVFSDRYSTPLDIKSDTINYWASTTQQVTVANCPDSAQWFASGLGAEIETHVSLNLSTLTKTNLEETRCRSMQ